MSREDQALLRQMLWADNNVQFPRLLAEIYEGGCISPQGWKTLQASMDLGQAELDELFLRAETEWEEIKEIAHQEVGVDERRT